MGRPRKEEITTESADKRQKVLKRTLKEIAKDLWLNDWFIKIGLAVSGLQLAIAFTYTSGTWWAVFLSGLTAFGKAAFVEGGVWLINKAIVWARVVKIHWGWHAVLWSVLMSLMLISVRSNLDYENEKKLAAKYPDAGKNGNPVIVANSKNVERFLDSDERADAWFRGGLVPLIVFASILVRRVISSARDEYQKEESKKYATAVRGVKYRQKKKQLEKILGGE